MTTTTASAPTATPLPAEPNAPAPTGFTHAEILRVMTGLLAALFTALISSTIVSTALPTIMSDLHGTQRQYTWVITASLLAMTISTPIWGKLSDLFDKKWLVQLSIVIFVAGSVGAGLSQTVAPMMAFRALQGLGMGGLTALAQSIIGAIIPPRQRGRYSGYMGAVMAVSTVSGPLLGGVITDHLNWRWCFFVCVPLAVVSMILLQLTLHLPHQRRRVTIDYRGAALIAVVAALPMLWVTFAGDDYAWISWQSAAFLGGFVLAVVLAVITELRVPEPVVPIRVLNNRTTALMLIASVGVGVAMFGSSTFLTQYFQLAGGHTPTRAGLMTIPLIITQMLSSTIGGQLVSRTGRWKPLMVVGGVMLVLGLAGLGTIDHTTPYWQVAIYMAVMGVGVGALIQNIVLAVQNTVDISQIGASSATISFFRSLGGAVGVAVLGAILANHVESGITRGLVGAGIPTGSSSAGGDLDLKDLPGPVLAIVRAAYGDSFGLLFLIGAGFAALTLIAVLLVREVPLRTTLELKPVAAGDGVTEDVAEHVDAPAEADGRSEVESRSGVDGRSEAERPRVSVTTVHRDSAAYARRLAALDERLAAHPAPIERDALLEARVLAQDVVALARQEAERILTEADRQTLR